MRDNEQAELEAALVGRTIEAVRLEEGDDDDDYQRLVLTTDQGRVVLRSVDYEGYRSWLRLVPERDYKILRRAEEIMRSVQGVTRHTAHQMATEQIDAESR